MRCWKYPGINTGKEQSTVLVDQYQPDLLFLRKEHQSPFITGPITGTFPSCSTSVRRQSEVHIPGITIGTTDARTGERRIPANRPRSPHASLPASLRDINRLSRRRRRESELRCARSASCSLWRTAALFDCS